MYVMHHVICYIFYIMLSEAEFDGSLHPVVVGQTDFTSIRMVCKLLDSPVVDSLRALHARALLRAHSVENVVKPRNLPVMLCPPRAREGVGRLTPGGVLCRPFHVDVVTLSLSAAGGSCQK